MSPDEDEGPGEPTDADNLPVPMMVPATVSVAAPGDGVGNPTAMDRFTLRDENNRAYAAMWRWRGNGYDSSECWFEFDRRSLRTIHR